MIGIRHAQERDIHAICHFDQMAQDDNKNRRKFIADSVKKQVCYVAEMDIKVMGYAVFDYNFYSNGMISMLYVDQDYRRQGVGTELIKHVESICMTEKLFTSTNQSNLPMQGLMNKMGYVPSPSARK